MLFNTLVLMNIYTSVREDSLHDVISAHNSISGRVSPLYVNRTANDIAMIIRNLYIFLIQLNSSDALHLYTT